MILAPMYLIDTDVMTTAKNRNYAFDICPAFWNSILDNHHRANIFSIDRVQNEIMAGHPEDDLVQWVTQHLPVSFFLSVAAPDILSAYSEIMLWVQRNPQFYDAAKAKFAAAADGWLVAYARVHAAVVVTNEQSAPDSKKEVKLPDICDQFDVVRADTFEMLRQLAVCFG